MKYITRTIILLETQNAVHTRKDICDFSGKNTFSILMDFSCSVKIVLMLQIIDSIRATLFDFSNIFSRPAVVGVDVKANRTSKICPGV